MLPEGIHCLTRECYWNGIVASWMIVTQEAELQR
jgi:hypothetical protein